MRILLTILGILISISSFTQELDKSEIVPFRSRKNGKVGYMNENNKIIVKPQYTSGTYFNNKKYATVSIGNDSLERYAVIDLKGNYFIGFDEGYEYLGLNYTFENWILISKAGKYGYMNEEKEILIPLEYEQLGGFFGQLAFAEKDSKYGYIDSVNRILIGFQFDKASNFGNLQPDGFRYAMVEKDYKNGYINNNGELVISFLYEEAYSFHNGLAVVKKDEKFGCVNTKGAVVIPFVFDHITNSGEIIKARKELTSSKEFYFDRQGTLIGTSTN